jgi:hypothetical protein
MGPTAAVVLAILLKPCQILAVALIYYHAMQRATPHPKKFNLGLAISVDHRQLDASHAGALLP